MSVTEKLWFVVYDLAYLSGWEFLPEEDRSEFRELQGKLRRQVTALEGTLERLARRLKTHPEPTKYRELLLVLAEYDLEEEEEESG